MPRCVTQALPIAAALLLVACSGEPASEVDAAQGESSFGLMSVTYEHDSASTDDTLDLQARAQFVRYAAMDSRYVGNLLALPLDPERDLPELDTCRVFDVTLDLGDADDAADDAEPGYVELLEAGNLRVETSTSTVTLKPRHFPALLPFISGVVYGEAQTAQAQGPGAVKVTADTGGDQVGAFSAELASPALPRLEGDTKAMNYQKGSGLSLRWQTADENTSADRGATTYAALRFSKGERELALRCRLRDDGAFEIPANVLDELSGASQPKLTLEVARLRRTSFNAPGLDRGELRITVRERAGLLLQ